MTNCENCHEIMNRKVVATTSGYAVTHGSTTARSRATRPGPAFARSSMRCRATEVAIFFVPGPTRPAPLP